MAHVMLYGYESELSSDRYWLSENVGIDPSTNEFKISYPGSTFSRYASLSTLATDDFWQVIYNKSAKSDFSIMNADGDASWSGSSVSYTVTGLADVVGFYFKQVNADWVIYAPAGLNQEVSVPELSDQITKTLSSFSDTQWKQSENAMFIYDLPGSTSISEFVPPYANNDFTNGVLSYKIKALPMGGPGIRQRQTEETCHLSHLETWFTKHLP